VIYRALGDARDDFSHDQIVLIHGGAVGADLIAARYAEAMDWGIEEYRAKWELYGKRAGIMRNVEMVEAGADVCLAFIYRNSRGATHCAGLAERAGIPVRRYRA
jgi:hypothetical protein